MSQKVIIDGYNVIYTDDRLRPLMIKNPEKARERFLSILKSYVSGKDLRITVVFDGKGGMTDAKVLLRGKLQVVFSRNHESADRFIIDTLKSSRNPREYIVVTSDDGHIGREARSMGASVIRSRRFITRIQRTEKERACELEKPEPGDENIDYWLRVFGRKITDE